MTPHTRLATLRVDGVAVPTENATVPAGHRSVEIEFAAGVLRDPHRVRYRTRIDDVAWTVTPDPVFRVASLPAGKHAVEAAASLDGVTWGEPFRLELSVAPAWFARGWVLGLFAAAASALGLAAHRVRTAYLVGLERQRTRIAMDLHDELGAGLGSLGILGGMVAEGSAPATAQRRVGETIARTAGELGGALHDIVYSLQTGEGRLRHLAEQLSSRGRTLFAGNDVCFTADIAVSEDGGISPAISRQAYRIAVEALHNAARHAGAENVQLGVHSDDAHGRVQIWVSDDGCGIAPHTFPEPGGMGLITMRRRAEAIGGSLEVESVPNGGTRIDLRFDARGAHSRRRERR
jgi:signal transduction histidine kinase